MQSFISLIVMVLCLGILLFIFKDAKKDIDNGKTTNGSQNAVSVGVLFTFIGISFSLWAFDSKNIEASIPLFIEGMKFAFGTSVLGMGFGMYIKHIQLKALDRAVDTKVEQSFSAIESIKGNLEGIKGSESKNLSDVTSEIVNLKKSVEANSIGELSGAMTSLSSSLTSFVNTSKESQDSIKAVSESMVEVSKSLGDLNDKLSGAIDDMATKQQQMLESLSENMVGAINDSSNKQMQALNDMNAFIEGMAKDSKAAAISSQSLLDKTIAFQDDSVEFYEAQKDTFAQNNASLDAMKTSFDTFLTNMAENYSKELINALNKTMEDLNNQLQNQFGDNFKELNAAVKDVVTWQDNYKDIVEKTTDEIQVLNSSFENFSNKVIPQTQENIGIMSTQLAKFTESADANIAVQDNLHISVEKLAEMIVEAKNQIESVQAVFSKFDEFTSGVIQATNDSMAKQQEAITKQQEAMIQKLGEYTSGVLQTTSDSMTKQQEAITEQQEAMIQKLGEYTSGVLQTTSDSMIKQQEAITEQQDSMIQKLSEYTERENTTIAEGISKMHDSVTQSVQTNLAAVTTAMLALQGDYKTYISSMQEVNEANLGMFENAQERIAAYHQTTQKATDKLDASLQQVVEKFGNSAVTIIEASEASAKKLTEQIDKSAAAIVEAAEVSNKKLADNLVQSTETTVKASEASVKKLTEQFDKSTEAAVKANSDTMKKYQDVLVETLDEYTNKENELLMEKIKDITENINKTLLDNADTLDKAMKKLAETADSYVESTKKADEANLMMLTDTKQYLKDYNSTTKKAMDEMGKTLEGFREDLRTQTSESTATLKVLFEQLANNTDEQQKKAIDLLAASLAAISNQMVNNYNALINRIAELDVIISRNNGGK